MSKFFCVCWTGCLSVLFALTVVDQSHSIETKVGVTATVDQHCITDAASGKIEVAGSGMINTSGQIIYNPGTADDGSEMFYTTVQKIMSNITVTCNAPTAIVVKSEYGGLLNAKLKDISVDGSFLGTQTSAGRLMPYKVSLDVDPFDPTDTTNAFSKSAEVQGKTSGKLDVINISTEADRLLPMKSRMSLSFSLIGDSSDSNHYIAGIYTDILSIEITTADV